METLYIVLIIVVVFIALIAAAIIGYVVVRNKQPRIPVIIPGNIPNIVPVTAPSATLSTANSVVKSVTQPIVANPGVTTGLQPVIPPVATLPLNAKSAVLPLIRVKDINEVSKYYVKGNDPFVAIFNNELLHYARITLEGDNNGYAELDFNDCINRIIEKTVKDDEVFYINGSYRDLNSGKDLDPEDALNLNPYERLLRKWTDNQPLHTANHRYHGYPPNCWLELYTIKYTNGDKENPGAYENIYMTNVQIIYDLDSKNGNRLLYRVDQVDMYSGYITDTQYYDIDNLDTMLRDINRKMPSTAV